MIFLLEFDSSITVDSEKEDGVIDYIDSEDNGKRDCLNKTSINYQIVKLIYIFYRG